MARHRREPTPSRRRLLALTAAAAVLVTGGVVVAGGFESVADRTVDATPDGSATAATPARTGSTPSAAVGAPSRSDRPDKPEPQDRPEAPDKPEPQGLPPTGEAPGFLGTTDLPQVPGLREDWVGTRPVDARTNISSSLCDSARFSTGGVTQEQTRTYVVPDGKRLPATFGLSETLGRFATPPAADRFLQQVRDRVASCEDRVSSASVDASERVRSPELSAGTRWSLSFDVGERAVRYRMGVVRVGDRVAQVSFSPSDRYDITAGAFDRLLVRAAQRLRELGSD